MGEISGRDESFLIIFKIIKDNFLFGIGKTGYNMYDIGSPHNLILEVLVYTGIFGFIFYFNFIYKILWEPLIYLDIKGNITLILLLIPISGLMLTGQILDSKLIWFVLAYYVSTITFYKLKINI